MKKNPKEYRVFVKTENGTSYFEIRGTIVPSQWMFWTTLVLPDGQRVEFPPVFKFEEKVSVNPERN